MRRAVLDRFTVEIEADAPTVMLPPMAIVFRPPMLMSVMTIARSTPAGRLSQLGHLGLGHKNPDFSCPLRSRRVRILGESSHDLLMGALYEPGLLGQAVSTLLR